MENIVIMVEPQWNDKFGIYLAPPPKPKWEWKVFGKDDLKIYFIKDVGVYTRWVTQLTLKSKWIKL